MNTKQKISGIALATAMAISNNFARTANAEEFCPPPPDNSNTVSNQTQAGGPGQMISNQVEKSKIIEALRSMKKSPESIKFHSAMCYKMAMPPETIDFTCPKCNTVTPHQYQSAAGEMTRRLPGFHRSLPVLPFKITMNESSLCSKCSHNAAPRLDFITECGECEKSFSWHVSEVEDLEKMGWLFLPYPIDSLDLRLSWGKQTDPAMTQKIVKFVSSKFFCPDCIKKLNLDMNE